MGRSSEHLDRRARAGSEQTRPAEPVRRAPVSSRLVVGAVGDAAERDADEIAAHAVALMRGPVSSPTGVADRPAGRIRRSAGGAGGAGGGAGDVRRLAEAPGGASAAHRDLDPEADLDGEDLMTEQRGNEPAQTAREVGDADGAARLERSPATRIQRAVSPTGDQFAAGTGAQGGPLDQGVADRIQRALGGGRTIDAGLQARVQPGFRTDLGAVRVHTDAEAARLSRVVNARAFTVGRDVFFGGGEYRPGSDAGMRLLAHELGHVEQQSAGRATARRAVIRRRFQPATARSKAHLRAADTWGTFLGPQIHRGAGLFIDDDPAGRLVQRRRLLPNVTWVPAVNVAPDQPRAAANDHVGYIRAGRAAVVGSSEDSARAKVCEILAAAEQRVDGGQAADKINQPAHVDFLLSKAVRLDEWNPAVDARAATFSAGLGSLQAKYRRITEGAEHVADTLQYWREWLFPGFPEQVDIVEVKLLESDLHEHGLGVMAVKFRKAREGGQAMFADQLVVDAIIKPEDKSLERSLVGAQADSAANRINELADLQGDERLGSLNMEVANVAPLGATPVWSTLVERVQGRSSEQLVEDGRSAGKGNGDIPVIPAFHETLVFAWLAGIDDLHWENVMWVGDVPYLIDADSVLMHDQMHKTGTGDHNQSGFSTFNKGESDSTREGIKALDPGQAKSKLLQAMVDDGDVRNEILDTIKHAIAGHKGRTLPIYTGAWARVRNFYQSQDAQGRDNVLDAYSTRGFIVRERRANEGTGPGLSGTTGVNPDDDFYDQAAVRAQLKRDMDAAVIPFFEYHYDTGHVTYNGVKIFHGLTLDQAFTALTAKFG